ncbi:MAG: hypothetical protein FJ276_32615, partial [Planctomycetes bacterium]|nr:hypothetical protein [Planctomycetota bacterium]
MQIDSTRRGVLPEMRAPVPFSCRKGTVRGWKVAIPGGHPLATPAVAQGRLFLGGGFGSYEFYCLNAETGELLWQYQTNDDGPTAAVVEDQFVAFNTESCELEVLTVDGKAVWKQWLGDPLMSMPAIANGRVFMAYPDTRHGGQHYLACFDVAAGQQLWRTPIVGEIITAPVLAEEKVFCATLDGTLYCCRQSDGSVVWHEGSNATSSPVVVDGQCYFSQRKETRTEGAQPVSQQTEHCAVRGSSPRAATREYGSTRRKAD